MLAGTVIAQASDSPLSRSRLTMWAGSAAVTPMTSTTNTPISTKGRTAHMAAEIGVGMGCVRAGAAGAGAWRSSRPCRGAQTRNCRPARHHNAGRQPHCAISQADSGMNTVLASPPRKVMVMMPRRKLSGKRRVTTANTGAYSVADMPAPSSAQTA
jgi:hypothetical protein